MAGQRTKSTATPSRFRHSSTASTPLQFCPKSDINLISLARIALESSDYPQQFRHIHGRARKAPDQPKALPPGLPPPRLRPQCDDSVTHRKDWWRCMERSEANDDVTQSALIPMVFMHPRRHSGADRARISPGNGPIRAFFNGVFVDGDLPIAGNVEIGAAADTVEVEPSLEIRWRENRVVGKPDQNVAIL